MCYSSLKDYDSRNNLMHVPETKEIYSIEFLYMTSYSVIKRNILRDILVLMCCLEDLSQDTVFIVLHCQMQHHVIV